MTARDPQRIVLAAGGTGGHMFPAQALARELLARGLQVALVTDRRGGGFGPDLAQVETHRISAGGLAGRGLFGKAANVLRMGLGFLQARGFIKAQRAGVVVGFGGHPSVPTVLAGANLGSRILLHEQNAVLGRANRLLAGRADVLATSFAKVEGIPETCGAKIRLTGNPVRPAIAALSRRPYAVPDGADTIRLLVTGGSQGASVFNDVVPDALCRLSPGLRARVQISQQVRGPELERIATSYDACGVRHELRAFFDDMPERLAATHLVICRAGASTITELAAAGRPGILVPYPTATDDHQTANAQRLAEAGGGWLIPQEALSASYLAERLSSLLSKPALLAKASNCARAAARDDAAQALADLVCAKGNDHDNTPAEHGEAAA